MVIMGSLDEALKKEVLELKQTLKMKQLQEKATLKSFAAKELELEEEIQRLKDQVVSLQKENEEVPIPQDLPLDLSYMQFDTQEDDSQMEETGLPKMPMPSADQELYSPQELELMAWIQKESDEISKQSMEWERRILHSTNLTYLKYGDASKDWHQPMLPYPL